MRPAEGREQRQHVLNPLGTRVTEVQGWSVSVRLLEVTKNLIFSSFVYCSFYSNKEYL